MRIAILILAHKNLEQLEKLVQRLTANFDVYLHLDGKWNIADDYFSGYKNVYTIKRFKINWGSYNQILATYELFKTAFLKDYDFYLIISGQDLPIKSNKQILEFLEKNKNHSFVNNDKLPTRHWLNEGVDNGGFDRIEYYWPDSYGISNFGDRMRRKAIYKLQNWQRKLKLKRSLYPIEYHGGWNWVNLNKDAVSYLVHFIEQNPSFLKKFDFTHCADEIWLQTVIMNSGLSIKNDYLRYVDWRGGGWSPKVLTVDDVPEILHSNCLFARKFDDKVDEAVITHIYDVTKNE